MRSGKLAEAFDKIIKYLVGKGAVVLVIYLYKWLFVQEYVFVRELKWKQALVFGLFTAVILVSFEKIAYGLAEFLHETKHYGPEQMHLAATAAFLVVDAVLWIIAVFKPEAAPYRLHGPSVAAVAVYLACAVREFPRFYKTDYEDLKYAVLEGVVFLVLLKSHYHLAVNTVLVAYAFAALLIITVIYTAIIGIQKRVRRRREEQEAAKTSYDADDFAKRCWQAEKAKYEQEFQQRAAEPERQEDLSFFQGCHDLEEVKKLYLSYCKILHPDNPDTGNEELFKRMKKQYEAVRKLMVA